MTERDKNLYTILAAAVIMAVYMLGIMPITRADIQHTENMISRRMNRIEARAQLPVDDAQPVGMSQLVLEKANQRFAYLDAERRQREALFAPLNSVDGVKQLRLEISHLADWAGFSIKKMGDLSGKAPVDTLVALERSTQNRYGRPVLRIEAEGDFTALMTFLLGLGELSGSVSVVRMKIEAPELTDSATRNNPYPLLTAHLELTL
ncbi:MAG: hypothetical protein AAGC57_13780 [Pseudomonadota bacterium]